MNLKPYDPALLKVLHRNRQPQDLRGCRGPEGRRYLDQADDLIFRSEAELDASTAAADEEEKKESNE